MNMLEMAATYVGCQDLKCQRTNTGKEFVISDPFPVRCVRRPSLCGATMRHTKSATKS